MLVGAGGFASRALKNSPQDCFSRPAGRRAVLISPAQPKNKDSAGIRQSLHFGGGGWIRKPRTEEQSTGLFFPSCGTDVLFSPLPPSQKIKTPPGYGEVFILVGAGGFEPPKQIAADLQSVPIGHSGTPPCCLAHSRALNYYSKTSYKMQAFFQNFFKKFIPLLKERDDVIFSLILPAISCRRQRFRQRQFHIHGTNGQECRCNQTYPGCLHGQTWRSYALPEPQR